MKHSSYGSMAESSLPVVKIAGNGLPKLYIDLCNLIVESRIPASNERGYGEGVHCPFQDPSSHSCDLSLPECQIHQNLIHYLMSSVNHHAISIEVMLFPDCCQELNVSEKILKKEYVLLERWSMNSILGKTQPTIDANQLLRAVRSFLFFSQISAWLNSTKGQSPAVIYYWIKPLSELSPVKFENTPDSHVFPISEINEDFQCVIEVKYRRRTQSIPHISCYKHPLQEPTISYGDSTLHQTSISHKKVTVSEANYQSNLVEKNIISDPISFLLSSSTQKIPVKSPHKELPVVRKIQKHASSQIFLSNSLTVVSKASEGVDRTKVKILPSSQSSNTGAEKYSNHTSHKSVLNANVVGSPEKEFKMRNDTISSSEGDSPNKIQSTFLRESMKNKSDTLISKVPNFEIPFTKKRRIRKYDFERMEIQEAEIERTLKEANLPVNQNRSALNFSHHLLRNKTFPKSPPGQNILTEQKLVLHSGNEQPQEQGLLAKTKGPRKRKKKFVETSVEEECLNLRRKRKYKTSMVSSDSKISKLDVSSTYSVEGIKKIHGAKHCNLNTCLMKHEEKSFHTQFIYQKDSDEENVSASIVSTCIGNTVCDKQLNALKTATEHSSNSETSVQMRKDYSWFKNRSSKKRRRRIIAHSRCIMVSRTNLFCSPYPISGQNVPKCFKNISHIWNNIFLHFM